MKKIDIGTVALICYELIAAGTFIFLMFFDNFNYSWWNWIVAIPLNLSISGLWPLYWGSPKVDFLASPFRTH